MPVLVDSQTNQWFIPERDFLSSYPLGEKELGRARFMRPRLNKPCVLRRPVSSLVDTQVEQLL
jgi:hypothetical protein